MRVAVLGATGAVGSLLVTTALERGLEVTALARNPSRVTGVRSAQVDVHDPASIARAVEGADVLVSGLGVTNGAHGTLTAGAKAAVASGVGRIVWLGAYGTGESAAAAGFVTRSVIGLLLRREIPDKVAADATVLAAGGTVFHVGPMGDGPAAHHTYPLGEAPTKLFPSMVSRAAVAAAMIDEAAAPTHPGQTVVATGGN
ncbi:NAD(P)-dependent oxidoreductase [Cryptosporangium sp. NPDC048952]|uniref:NAD(P)-dependent oxidoreductase n=1 Tax=Cryptosporangium sp. NPDC048952 TaxID=3363961 RepID=UPI00371D1014